MRRWNEKEQFNVAKKILEIITFQSVKGAERMSDLLDPFMVKSII